jgi:hypothetical protein
MLKIYKSIYVKVKMSDFSKLMSKEWEALSEREKDEWRVEHYINQNSNEKDEWRVEHDISQNASPEPAPVVTQQSTDEDEHLMHYNNSCEICGCSTMYPGICVSCQYLANYIPTFYYPNNSHYYNF